MTHAANGSLAGIGLPFDREQLTEALRSANAARYTARERAREVLPLALVALAAWKEEDRDLPIAALEERLDLLLGRPSRRLAAYGSLRPGQPNHWRVADLGGTWRPGRVRGVLDPLGGGRTGGWPTLVPDEGGGEIDVSILDAEGLPARWPALDEFESPLYRRVLVIVDCGAGLEVANLYADAGT